MRRTVPVHHDQEDDALIRNARQGDEQACARLVRKYQVRVHRTAFRLVGNTEDAQDIAQNAFVSAFANLHRFRDGSRLFTWLYRIVVNASFDHLKRSRRFVEVPLDEAGDQSAPDESARIFADDAAQALLGLLDRLSTAQKATFLLRDVEGFSIRETAAMMAVSTGTVKNHLHFARKRLQALIKRHYPEFLEDNHYALPKRD